MQYFLGNKPKSIYYLTSTFNVIQCDPCYDKVANQLQHTSISPTLAIYGSLSGYIEILYV